MSNDFRIGVSSHGKTTTSGRTKFFYLKDNEDNVFRVLPPLFTLAEYGKYAQWYAVHRGLRGTDGKQKVFLCLEESDRKTRLVTRRCPLCDKANELEAQVKMMKEKGATAEQIKNFRIKTIMPVQVEKKYYINVVNQENQIGTLAISSRMFNALRALCEEQDKKGIDITGKDGIFLNFKKQTKFKGDKDAVHSTILYLQASADGAYRSIIHQLTPDFIERLKTEASDLSNLFKSVSPEEVAALAAAGDADRAVLIDRIFVRPEKNENKLESNETTIPGTTATAVNRLEVTGQGLAPKNFGATTSAAPAPSAPSAPLIEGKGLSNEEFQKMFMPK